MQHQREIKGRSKKLLSHGGRFAPFAPMVSKDKYGCFGLICTSRRTPSPAGTTLPSPWKRWTAAAFFIGLAPETAVWRCHRAGDVGRRRARGARNDGRRRSGCPQGPLDHGALGPPGPLYVVKRPNGHPTSVVRFESGQGVYFLKLGQARKVNHTDSAGIGGGCDPSRLGVAIRRGRHGRGE